MVPLVQLIREYQKAKKLEHRFLLAEAIIKSVGSDLRAFFASRWPSDQAEELADATLVAIANGLMSVRARTDRQAWGWCYGIARNKHNDQCRSKVAMKTELVDPQEMAEIVEASAVQVPIGPAERLDLVYAMNLLRAAKPPCYDYLWGYYIRDLDYEDIEGLDSLSRDAARMKVQRCLELAQELMAKHP